MTKTNKIIYKWRWFKLDLWLWINTHFFKEETKSIIKKAIKGGFKERR